MEHPTPAPPRLILLKSHLTHAPPSLRHLVDLSQSAEDYQWFRDLVHNIFPNQAVEILQHATQAEKVAAFCKVFSKDFFPLPDYYIDDWAYEDEDRPASHYRMIREGAPIPMMGFSLEDLHELWNHAPTGLAALALLTDFTEHWAVVNDIKTAWFEAAEAHIPQSVLQKIPPGGIPHAKLKQAVQDTKYAAATTAVLWITSASENEMIDLCIEDYGEQIMSDWNPDSITAATDMWKQADQLTDQVLALASLLEEDLPVRFEEALDFILQRLPPPEEEQNDG